MRWSWSGNLYSGKAPQARAFAVCKDDNLVAWRCGSSNKTGREFYDFSSISL
jgi:hypothetical protein